jgi:glucosamine--fructose-6-phosphate aminotransferase (isomerizing)
MCGIFGVALNTNSSISRFELDSAVKKLFLLSESRGKESAGIHFYAPGISRAWTIKTSDPASVLINTNLYKQIFKDFIDLVYCNENSRLICPVIILAHSRLVTNGTAELSINNQPVRSDGVSLVHNGIIVNDKEIWNKYKNMKKLAEVDSEVISALLSEFVGNDFDPIKATRKAFSEIKGSATIAWVIDNLSNITLATNTGDLYIGKAYSDSSIFFASERFILESTIKKISKLDSWSVENVSAGSLINIELLPISLKIIKIPLLEKIYNKNYEKPKKIKKANQSDSFSDYKYKKYKVFTVRKKINESLVRYNKNHIETIKRCSYCILPDTFPFINFDDKGVCNFCRNYKPKYKGVSENAAKIKFASLLEKYKSKTNSLDVVVPFSGGRDSCYGLHLIKNEFKLNPITFTYDWGMVTDLARRNIARFCGELGVQNILVSSDIKRKRENIRKNVSAWLKKPDLGIVPLFMAGDKQFFKIVNEVKRQTGIKLDLWSANPLENTEFKSGFCGVSPDFEKERLDYLSISRKINLCKYYLKSFIQNPSYINNSLFDTCESFFSYYLEPRNDFFFIFNHLIWKEEEVNNLIINRYGFEQSPDSSSTWRIGDGTAPFYNYIYLTAKGFTEFDTFRSNQIREGHISREEALRSILEENTPRIEGLIWYLDKIGLDFNSTIHRINQSFNFKE